MTLAAGLGWGGGGGGEERKKRLTSINGPDGCVGSEISYGFLEYLGWFSILRSILDLPRGGSGDDDDGGGGDDDDGGGGGDGGSSSGDGDDAVTTTR